VSEIEHEHLTKEILERYFSTTQSDEVARMLLHLVAVCPECRAVGGSILAAYKAGAIGVQFSSVDVALFESRMEAEELWEVLRPLSYAAALRRIRRDSEFVTWGLAELLARESQRSGASDAARAVELATLSVEVATRVSEWEPCEEEWLFELRAFAYAHLVNAYRISCRIREAEKAERKADEWWAKGKSMGDILGYEAEIVSIKAALRNDQGRFEEALSLLDKAEGIYLAGDPESQDLHLAGRTLVLKANTYEHMGELERALDVLRESSPLIDPERDPRLLLCVQHNILNYLARLGRPEDARAMLPRVRKLSENLGNDLDLIRLTWTEGLLADAADQGEEAAELLLSAQAEFAGRGMGYDAALVSLDLAALYLKEGRAAETAALAREMVSIFEAEDIHGEALAALAVFQEAALRHRLGADLLSRVARYLEEARTNPGLKFEK
jgi:tetratricopeptide (TPR) repeat protein